MECYSGEIMICNIHNLVIRIGKCPKCKKEAIELRELQWKIDRMAETIDEVLNKPIQLWPEV